MEKALNIASIAAGLGALPLLMIALAETVLRRWTAQGETLVGPHRKNTFESRVEHWFAARVNRFGVERWHAFTLLSMFMASVLVLFAIVTQLVLAIGE